MIEGAQNRDARPSCTATDLIRGIAGALESRYRHVGFLAQKLQLNAFSTLPSNLIDMPKIGPLAPILAMDLLENGDPAARNVWVNQQVFNLLAHARANSKFWAARLDRKAPNNLARAPVFRRQELVEQVQGEGCLPLSGQHRHAKPNVTSGSTGVASRFFISDMNAAYNGLRGAAQYLFEGRSLELNRVALSHVNVDDKRGYTISQTPHWAGPLAEVFRNGSGRTVNFQFPDFAQLGEELLRKPCGYFNSIPPLLVALANAMGQEKFTLLQIKEFISRGQQIPAETRELCREYGIRIRDTYSCEECGPIAFECSAIPGAFHVATSNVVVECEEPLQHVDGERVGKLLITHLHSYATPFIRYEIGDLGALAPECALRPSRPDDYASPRAARVLFAPSRRRPHKLRHASGLRRRNSAGEGVSRASDGARQNGHRDHSAWTGD